MPNTFFYRLGLIGWPLGHSLSPRLHNAALQAMGLAGEYSLYPVPPPAEGERKLENLLIQVRRGNIQGLNVTIPHKQTVLSLMDELTPAALAIGAVNTIFLSSDRLVGDNTDAPGLLADLQRLGFFLGDFYSHSERKSAKKILILGAGGSARAAAWVLARAGGCVTIAARRPEQAQEVATSLGGLDAGLTGVPLEPDSLEGDFALIINTTPLGMSPYTEGNPWPESLPFPAGAAVYDLVYNPPVTPLLRRALQDGLQAANGMGMLVEQAALALEMWTGKYAPREAMWKAIRPNPRPLS